MIKKNFSDYMNGVGKNERYDDSSVYFLSFLNADFTALCARMSETVLVETQAGVTKGKADALRLLKGLWFLYQEQIKEQTAPVTKAGMVLKLDNHILELEINKGKIMRIFYS